MTTAREALLDRAVAWFAERGVGDTSMRSLATALDTSHRMLHYHFGSREALLGAVMERVEQGERDVLEELVASVDDPFEAGAVFWHHVADRAQTFAPLYFELSSHAMLDRPYAGPWRTWLVDGWTEPLARLYAEAGAGQARATELARLSLAQARGLVFELALTGDRAAADDAMVRFTAMMRTTVATDGVG